MQFELSMKRIVFFVSLLLFILGGSAFAQSDQSPTVQQTLSAIRKEDVSLWMKAAAPRIWINLNQENKSYSRQQAEIVLKEFFSDNKITHFTHGITQTGQTTVIIGEITTVYNRKYHLVCKLKGNENSQQIVEISISAL